ncbi:MAG: FCD domain-containing protein [Geminicoccaceae bacterium]
MFKGLTREFAQELYEIREMFSSACVAMGACVSRCQPTRRPGWSWPRSRPSIAPCSRDRRFLDFSRLDDRLHRLIYTAARNRFILDFYAVISMIFHYHYQWNEADEKERNRTALHEHLAYIAALRGRDRRGDRGQLPHHLASARQTLLLDRLAKGHTS